MTTPVFEVGDRVYLPTTRHLGTIVQMVIEQPHNAPDAAGVRRYDIKLDDGGTITGVYRGIEQAPR
jgi:hypothetical protein